MKNQPNKVSRTGIELKDGQTYWYPTVPNCCHFSSTKVLCFKYQSTDNGNVDFVNQEFIYESEEEAKAKANEIRCVFGLPFLT